MNKIKDYKAKYPLTYHKDVLTGPFVVEEIYRQTNGEAIITTDVGQHQMWAAQYYHYKEPRTLPVIRRTWHHGFWCRSCNRSQSQGDRIKWY